ncbi:glucosylceramidase [Actinoplanes sp. SE50]|uniref:ricin-type beta-trefoil lectin domain protein n=1 Tax=unclassified Actinoplanes TaxID=2626549 RepID=UPI00023EC579|nr:MULTISPECIES: ricin-type beta-trefoil lectin domain protein [unclassified Actinoplanes]AEV81932.1 glucosylceramidase [Actinoplanes sp. SE50/110]ATO80332.1 glucosylceramidase [Actinoplanes sp. SE50]SLL97738.1 glucosylceramidase [Actinoplanes sp. SE50/110]
MRKTLFAAAILGGSLLYAPAAQAAGETVSVYLTTTSDSAGRTVTRGLQQQTNIAFGPAGGSAGTTINVDEGTTYQTFEGGGASITDTTAYLLRGGAVSAATRDAVMTKLFSPTGGIGLSFVRNPIGASDLSRPGNVSLDDTCCDLADFGANGYDTNVRLLTQQAKQLNPSLRVMAVPWSAPGWMKDNGRMDQMGWLKAGYYPMYAQYLVKYLQSYQAAGVPVDYLSVQNEPNCCQASNPTAMTYPGMSWNPSGLVEFTKNNVYPALHAAGLNTRVLVHDWNYGDYASFGSGILGDAGIRTDPAFGGIAWHGYSGSASTGSDVHATYPAVKQFETEHSGGTWIGDQHNEDLNNIIDYTRNWGASVVKWSLGVDQNMGPHNGGCGTCTGFITVQNGGSRAGQVDYTVEYYTMGHLTRFVKPGAVRIDSNDGSAVRNVAWRNPDGSKALIAHNGGTSSQSVRVNWGGQSFIYTLPARTTATFTWSGTAAPDPSGTITGLAGKCVDVAGAATANGTAVQLYTCNSSAAQRWTRASDGTLRALGKCLDIVGPSTADGTLAHLWDCHTGASQKWTYDGAGQHLINSYSGKCLDVKDNSSADATRLQVWTCTSGANQKWVLN